MHDKLYHQLIVEVVDRAVDSAVSCSDRRGIYDIYYCYYDYGYHC